MITIVGTHHRDIQENDFLINRRVKLDRFDVIFTEGISPDTDSFLQQVNNAVDGEEDFNNLAPSDIGRGSEPEAFDNVDAEVVYLDENLTDETVLELARNTNGETEFREVYPFDRIEHELIKGTDSRADYIQFFRDLRDMDISEDDAYSDYASLKEKDFDRLMQFSADQLDRTENKWGFEIDYSESFLEGLKEHDVTFEDYVKVFAENRNGFQDRRDQEWHEQITEILEEGQNALLVTGIQHALDYENTVRNLLEQDYSTSVSPYRRFN